MLGGDLGSRTAPNGVHHDVYPHMYLNWYHNFWRLLSNQDPPAASSLADFFTLRMPDE